MMTVGSTGSGTTLRQGEVIDQVGVGASRFAEPM